MDSLSNDPNDALVFHCNRNRQENLLGSSGSINQPLDVGSIISSDVATENTENSAVEKIEIWVNGVKRVIFVPLGNNPAKPCIPSELFNPSGPCNRTEQCSPLEARDSVVTAGPNPASLVVVSDARSSSSTHTESWSRSTVANCSTGENTVLLKSVSTNTVDQLPNRCVATVAPQINHDRGRLLVSTAFDDASKSKEFSVKETTAIIKQEKLASVTNYLNVRTESDDALALGGSIGHTQPFIHHAQHLTEHQRLLNLNQWHCRDRNNDLQKLGYDEPGRLPTTHDLTRNAVPLGSLHPQSSYAQFALPNTNSFNGQHRLPTQVSPYFQNPTQTTVLTSNSLRPNVNMPGRGESHHFSSGLGISEPTVGSKELYANRSAQMQVPNVPPQMGKPTAMVPNFPLQRYQHLLETLDPSKPPYRYDRISAQDDTQLSNIYAPLARFPTRDDFPYSHFRVRLSSNEQVAGQVVRGDPVHSQFPAGLPINRQVSQVTSFNNGHRFLGYHPNYMNSFVHAANQTRPELHNIPSSIVSFNDHASRLFLSETGHHQQSAGIGQAAHSSLNFKQLAAVPGGNLTLHRVSQNRPKTSRAEPEMSQTHAPPASCLRYSNLQGSEQVPSLRGLKGIEQSTLHVQNLISHRLPSAPVQQPFRPSPAHREIIHPNIFQPVNREITPSSIFQPVNREIAQSSIFQPMNGILYNNACKLDMPQFIRSPQAGNAFSQNVISDFLSQYATVPGLRIADEQNSSSLHAARYSSPSPRATFSQHLVSQSFLSPNPGGPLRSVSQNLSGGYSQELFSLDAQTTRYLQPQLLSETSKSQSDVDVENHKAEGYQSHLQGICNSIEVEDAFRSCTEINNETIPVIPSSGSRSAVCDSQPFVTAGSTESMTLASTKKGVDKNLDGILTDSNNESAKSAAVNFNDNIVPLCSSKTVLDASHSALPEMTVSTSLSSRLEPSNNLQPSTEQQDPRCQAPSLPGSPMSEIMNSIDKISDDLSMQKWLDSLIGNISDSSRDGFDSQAKSRTADLATVGQTSTKDMTTAAGGALVCTPSMAKQVDVKKSKRTWIGIKSIEAEMSPKSLSVKAKRRKRRRLTMRSNQSPEGSCDASSDSWHPDSFASSESSMDSIPTSTQASCTELSWCSDDSVTMGKRAKKCSRKSVRSKNHARHSRDKHTRRSHNLSPWCRSRPRFGEIRGCFVSLEVLSLQGKSLVNVTRASEFLCCSSRAKSRTVHNGSDTEDSYGSWCPFKSKKRLLKCDSKRTRNTVKSGSETEDSYSSRRRSNDRKLTVRLRYSKSARNVIMSGSDAEISSSLQERSKVTRHLLKSKNSRPFRYITNSGSDSE